MSVLTPTIPVACVLRFGALSSLSKDALNPKAIQSYRTFREQMRNSVTNQLCNQSTKYLALMQIKISTSSQILNKPPRHMPSHDVVPATMAAELTWVSLIPLIFTCNTTRECQQFRNGMKNAEPKFI